jgi:amidase
MQELSIQELQQKMEAGTATSRSIVEVYLQQIKEISEVGPAINAVIEINPDALGIADVLDDERKNGRVRGPLHGIPIMLKDIIETGDNMHTSAGSVALKDHIAKEDAFIVVKLREAGAIILGKNTLSEWGNFRSTKSISGWSSLGGQTKNPYVLDRNPCGSSSGTATAVAANLCSVGVGGETDGSIICPSNTNGVVALKPTLGLLSRAGIIPISHSQDTAGPIARTVTDMAVLLGAMVGVDPNDDATQKSDGFFHKDYTKFLQKDGLEGARIGVARNFFGFNVKVDAIMEECINVLKNQGAVIIEDTNIKTVDKLGETEIAVLLYEFKHNINTFLSKIAPHLPAHNLEELIAFNVVNKDITMPHFGQERFEMAQEKGPLTEAAYIEALTTNYQLSRDEGIDAVCSEHNLDAIIAPSGGPAWKTDYELGDVYEGGSSSASAVSGYPNLTVPAGYIDGLPVGISFMGTAYQEPNLIKLAFTFEQATLVRKPPQFIKTIG